MLISGNSGVGSALASQAPAFGATVTASNLTVSGSNATDASGGIALLADGAAAQISLTNATLAQKTSGGGGTGALRIVTGGSISARNVLLTTNDGGACSTGTALTSLGNNITDEDSCALGGIGDSVVGDPRIGGLAQNGGTTATHALLAGSAAVDSGAATGCPATDQRGVDRPQGGVCDIGAYEAQPDLAVSVGDTPDPVPSGQTLTYSVTVANVGVSADDGVSLLNALPDGVSFLSASGGCSSSGFCSLGSIGPGSSKTVLISTQPTAVGAVTDTATAMTTDDDVNLTNNIGTATTTVLEPVPPPPPPPPLPGHCTIIGSPGRIGCAERRSAT